MNSKSALVCSVLLFVSQLANASEFGRMFYFPFFDRTVFMDCTNAPPYSEGNVTYYPNGRVKKVVDYYLGPVFRPNPGSHRCVSENFVYSGTQKDASFKTFQPHVVEFYESGTIRALTHFGILGPTIGPDGSMLTFELNPAYGRPEVSRGIFTLYFYDNGNIERLSTSVAHVFLTLDGERLPYRNLYFARSGRFTGFSD